MLFFFPKTGDSHGFISLLGCLIVIFGFIGAIFEEKTCGKVEIFLIGSFSSFLIVSYSILVRQTSLQMPISEVMLYTNLWNVLLLLLPASLHFNFNQILDNNNDTNNNVEIYLEPMIYIALSCICSILVNLARFHN